MSARHGLSTGALAQITGVLARHPEVERAILFGSRAKATHKPGSDIDLSLVGPVLNWRIVGRIYDELDDLMLPHRFSLIVFDAKTDADVAAHIRRVGIPIFERERAPKELLGA